MISEIIDNTCINGISKIEASVLLPIVLFQMAIPRCNSLNSLRYSQSELARFTSFISLSLTFTPLLLDSVFFFSLFSLKDHFCSTIILTHSLLHFSIFLFFLVLWAVYTAIFFSFINTVLLYFCLYASSNCQSCSSFFPRYLKTYPFIFAAFLPEFFSLRVNKLYRLISFDH